MDKLQCILIFSIKFNSKPTEESYTGSKAEEMDIHKMATAVKGKLFFVFFQFKLQNKAVLYIIL